MATVNIGESRQARSLATLIGIIVLMCPAIIRASWAPASPGLTPSAPRAVLLEETSDHLIVRWDISGADLDPVATPAGNFYRLHFGDDPVVSASTAGTPLLPLAAQAIHLPDHTIPRIAVLHTEWEVLGNYRLMPRQYPGRDNEDSAPEFQFNPDAYSSSEIIPALNAAASAPQGWSGILVAGISVTPFRYQPSTGRLEIAQSMTVRVDFVPGGAPDVIHPRHQLAEVAKMRQATLLNPPAADPRIFDADDAEPVRILFIMWNEAQEVMQPLIDFHHNTGLKSEVWIVDGNIDTADIKDRIRDLYADGLEYVFIAGDAYKNSCHVPMHHWAPDDPGLPDPDGLPTDTYSDSWYVCLDGPDPDGYDDHLPDLAIGRLVYSMDNLDQLQVQVDKLMDYLNWTFNDPEDAEWLGRAILIGHKEVDRYTGKTEYINCKESIASHNYDLHNPDWIKIYGNDANNWNQTIIDEINDTHIGIVNYRGHGNQWSWAAWNKHNESWTKTQVAQLDNRQHPFLLVSSACENADVAVYGSNCLLESFQKDSCASFSAHGSIISSYTDGNSYFDKAIFRAWFDDGVWSLGNAQMQADVQMVQTFDQEGPHGYMLVGRMNMRTYIWLGDPALEVRTAAPKPLNVTFFPVPEAGDTSVHAIITLGDQPISGARICLRSDDDATYSVAETNNDGVAELELPDALPIDAERQWTAYARNAIPVSGNVFAAEGAGAIQGTVTEFANGSPVADAKITLLPFHALATTDADGNYNFTGVPAMDCRLTVTAGRFLPESRDVSVQADDTIIEDFALRFAQLSLDSSEMRFNLNYGDTVRQDVTLHNLGNGAVQWWSGIEAVGDRQPYDLQNLFNATEEVGDDHLLGVEFACGDFFIAGSNHNGDPNKIYVLDRDGGLVRTFDQPVPQSSGVGIRDLAWDGTHLLGSSNTTDIFKLLPDGKLDGTITGPYSPSKALAVDDDGNIWCGKDDQPLVKIDANGNRLKTLYPNYDVKALAWYPDAPDGHNLLVLDSIDANHRVMIHKINPATGDKILAADLTGQDDLNPGEGLCVGSGIESGSWSLAAMLRDAKGCFVKVWHLGYQTDWIALEPASGTIPANEDANVTLVINATGRNAPETLRASVVLGNNGLDSTVTFSVIAQVGLSVANEPGAQPTTFTLATPRPNPFNAVTIVPIYAPESGRLQVRVFDTQGRLVGTLTDAYRTAGWYSERFDAGNLPAGIYLVQAKMNGVQRTAKMALLK